MTTASLPMYDWPEVEAATNRLWTGIAARLRHTGMGAPDHLVRAPVPSETWRSPELVLSQTCGYPFANALGDHVALIGTPAYAIDCVPGGYFSVIVTRRADKDRRLSSLTGGRLAFNAKDSQSGYRALARWISRENLPCPSARIETGSHRASIQAVASGGADFAAIDAVTWQLALDHEPAARLLAAVARTPSTPGLPMITAKTNGARRTEIASVVSDAIAALATADRTTLAVTGFVARPASDYDDLIDDGADPYAHLAKAVS